LRAFFIGKEMKTLELILGEDPRKNFLDKCFTKIPYSLPNGGKNLKHHLDWKAVQDIIDSKNSILRIVKDGVMIKDYVDMSYEQAQRYYKSGHTLLVKNAEKSSHKFKTICDDFEKSFFTPVDVQLYCTPQDHNAFGWHYDVEEVFIIQTSGSKEYTIRPNTIHPNPLINSISKDLGFEKETSEIQIKVILEEGDFLYIPSGWWHIAKTIKESMHISIGLMPSSAVDMAKFLPSYLSKKNFWRTRLPIHKTFQNDDEEINFYQDAMTTLGKDLTSHISSREFIKCFLQWKKER
jgi:50S ribosomal protein L16 3-hydroxylase